MVNKLRVLFVDDNVNLLSSIRRVVRGKVDLVTAESASDAMQILMTDQSIAAVVSDQNMPTMKGVDFLAEVAKKWPLVVRVMQTGNSDQDTAIAAINAGQVFRFIRKPYAPEQLLEIIEQAVEHHKVLTAEQRLLETTLAGSVKLLTELLGQMRPDIFAQAMEVNAISKSIARKIAIPHAWELDIASLLYSLGLVTLPANLQAKLANDVRLTVTEKNILDQSANVAASLIANIPKLENVAKYVALSRRGYDGSGYPDDGPVGDDIPLISRVLRIGIDISYLASVKKISIADASMQLVSNPSPYDHDLLGKIAETLVFDSATLTKNTTKITVEHHELRAGDHIINDIKATNGRLMLKRGAVLTELTISRLNGLLKVAEIDNNFEILRAQD